MDHASTPCGHRQRPLDALPRPDSGFFISLTLPEGVPRAPTGRSGFGLGLTDGQGFFPNGGGERFVRLPYCALSPAEIDDAIQRLAKSVKAVR